MKDLRHGRVPSLDGLRALAILLVLLAHSRASYGCGGFGWFDWTATHGLLGVEIFFSISGFLITLLMLRECERTGRVDLRAFYSRRSLRILPAYVSLLIVVACLQRFGLASYSRGDWLHAVSFTFNFRRYPTTWELEHLWSLSIEEQFYLVWPLLFLLTPARRRAVIPILAMVVALLSRCVFVWVFQRYNYAVRAWTCCRIDTIAAGCLLAIVAWHPRGQRLLQRVERLPINGWAAFALLCVSIFLTRHWPAWDSTVSYSVNAVVITWLLWKAVQQPHSTLGRVLNSSWIARIGAVSYGIYLWQQFFLKNTNHIWTTFPQNLLLTMAAALASYFLIERPFLRVKKIFQSIRAGRTQPSLVRVN